MRIVSLFLILTIAACHAAPDAAAGPSGNGGEESGAQPPDTPLRPASSPPKVAQGEWRMDGARLTYVDAASGSATMTLACATGMLRVSLPGVTPIGSEERLTFGGGGDLRALVAGHGNGAVAAEGPAPPPSALIALLEAGPGASYGATAIGPLVPVPADLAKGFASGCR